MNREPDGYGKQDSTNAHTREVLAIAEKRYHHFLWRRLNAALTIMDLVMINSTQCQSCAFAPLRPNPTLHPCTTSTKINFIELYLKYCCITMSTTVIRDSAVKTSFLPDWSTSGMDHRPGQDINQYQWSIHQCRSGDPIVSCIRPLSLDVSLLLRPCLYHGDKDQSNNCWEWELPLHSVDCCETQARMLPLQPCQILQLQLQLQLQVYAMVANVLIKIGAHMAHHHRQRSLNTYVYMMRYQIGSRTGGKRWFCTRNWQNTPYYTTSHTWRLASKTNHSAENSQGDVGNCNPQVRISLQAWQRQS